MLKRLIAIVFIFSCASVAWMILGATITARTSDSDTGLREHVQSIWGAPHSQNAPFAVYDVAVPNAANRETRRLRPLSSDIGVTLEYEPRQKGLLWYSTYRVAFRGDYVFHNPEADKVTMRLCLPLPAAQAMYDGLQFTFDGRAETPVVEKAVACAQFAAAPDQSVALRTATIRKAWSGGSTASVRR